MPRHHTVVIDAPETSARGDAREAPSVASPFPFEELLVSWNVDRPAGAAFAIEVSLRDESGRDSPWLEIGVAGDVPRDRERRLEYEGGRIDVDWFRATAHSRFVSARARLREYSGAPRFRRAAFCFTDRRDGNDADPGAPSSAIELTVPFASQQSAREDLRSRICSPTSLAMVLRFRGVDATAEAIASRVYDAEHDVYGNWPRSIQVAYEAGCPGYLTRFSDWSSVEDTFAMGQPIIASIGVEPGQLTGAPYERTSGHLIVLRGFDARGDVWVNDPAANDETSGRRAYSRRELETVWMRRGGTAYVIEAPRQERNG